jgi:hypothetical protein
MPTMPTKPSFATEMDLKRARQIVRTLPPLKGLSADDAEFVARAIAQCFVKGREQGLHQAKAEAEELRDLVPKCSLHSIWPEQHDDAAMTEGY